MTTTVLVWPGATNRLYLWQVPLLILGAALVVARPEVGLLATAAIWTLIGLWTARPGIAIAAPFAALIMIPADHIAALNDARLGFFVFGAAVLLVTSTVRYRVRTRLIRSDWDIYLLIGVLSASTLLNSSLGELRGLLFWAAAGLAAIWLRRESAAGTAPGRQLVAAIAFAGSVGGAIAILARLTGSDLTGLLPGYQPHNLAFSSDIGTRGVGLSGHPLRLGTITMLSSLIAFGWQIEERSTGRHRLRTYLVLSVSLIGLILSGARGAWLSLLLGLFAIGLLKSREGEFGRFAQMTLLAAAVGVIVSATGLSQLIYERIFGSAVHVGSLAQRLEALHAIAAYWRTIPFLGLGFGGAAEITGRAGLQVPNLENEYLRFFITAGVAGPLALAILGGRRLLKSLRRPASVERTITIGLLVAVFADAATYNLFSWSAGPCLLVGLTFLALPDNPDSARI